MTNEGWLDGADVEISLQCHRCASKIMRVYNYERMGEKIAEIFCARCGMLMVLAIGENRDSFIVNFK